MKIKEYILIEGHSNENTASKIQAKLKEGWQPYGSPFGRFGTNGTIGVIQAMVKHELSKRASK